MAENISDIGLYYSETSLQIITSIQSIQSILSMNDRIIGAMTQKREKLKALSS